MSPRDEREERARSLGGSRASVHVEQFVVTPSGDEVFLVPVFGVKAEIAELALTRRCVGHRFSLSIQKPGVYLRMFGIGKRRCSVRNMASLWKLSRRLGHDLTYMTMATPHCLGDLLHNTVTDPAYP